MHYNSRLKTRLPEEVDFARRSFLQAAGAFGILLTGCGGGSGGSGLTNAIKIRTAAPEITLQPSSQAVSPGESATFEVGVSSLSPITYQWQRDGVDISGATKAIYATPPLTLQDSGDSYEVLVSSNAGSIQSATVTVNVTASGITVDSTFVTVDALVVINQ